MSSHNASSVVNSQEWRNDLTDNKITPDQPKTDDNSQKQMLAQICCSQPNCNKTKLEAIPEQFYMPEKGQTADVGSANPPAASMEEGEPPAEASSGKEQLQPNAPEQYISLYCPYGIDGGHFVTYCCTRRDCDDATKIDGVRRSKGWSYFTY